MSVIVSVPSAPALATMPPVWNTDCPASASLIVSVPVSVRVGSLKSSVTAPMPTPAITGRSLVPVTVTATSCGVPSAASTVKVSSLVSPAGRYCTALLATE